MARPAVRPPWFLGLWLCLFALALPFAAAAQPVAVPPMSSRVVDLADALTPEQADTLQLDIAALEEETQAQLAILIVPTTGEDSIEQYATRVFEHWKLGRQEQDDGLLVLVALKDRRMRIEVGQGLEGTVTDLQAAHIIDGLMTPAFRREDYAGGLQAAVQTLGQLVRGQVLALPGDAGSNAQDPRPFGGSVTPAGWAVIGIWLWCAVVGFWQAGQGKPVQRTPDEHLARHRSRQSRRSRKGRRPPIEPSEDAASRMSPTRRPLRRWPFTLAALAAAPVAGAVLMRDPVMAPMLSLVCVPLGFATGFGCRRWTAVRYITAGVLLVIAAVVVVIDKYGGEALADGVFHLVVLAIAALMLWSVVAGMRMAWRKSFPGFLGRGLIVVAAVFVFALLLSQGLSPRDFGIALGGIGLLAATLSFLPIERFKGDGRNEGSSSRWTSSSNDSGSSSSSSSSSDSSSSGGGGSSSGGGASGSW